MSEGVVPSFHVTDASRLLLGLYGIATAVIEPLDSYYDQNFRVEADGERFVLKIWNSMRPRVFLELHEEVMLRLDEHGIGCPKPQLALDGATIVAVRGPWATHQTQLLSWVEGVRWDALDAHPPQLLHDLGVFLGRLDNALYGLDHPAAHRTDYWDMRQLGQSADYLPCVADPDRRRLVAHFLREFEARVSPALESLRRMVIHNDVSALNLFTDATTLRVVGVIDFGALVHGAMVSELAIAVAYALFGQRDLLPAAATMTRGYHSVRPLSRDEVDLLYDLVPLRLCASVLSAAYRRTLDSANAYSFCTEVPAWRVLEGWFHVDSSQAQDTFRRACDM